MKLRTSECGERIGPQENLNQLGPPEVLMMADVAKEVTKDIDYILAALDKIEAGIVIRQSMMMLMGFSNQTSECHVNHIKDTTSSFEIDVNAQIRRINVLMCNDHL